MERYAYEYQDEEKQNKNQKNASSKVFVMITKEGRLHQEKQVEIKLYLKE